MKIAVLMGGLRFDSQRRIMNGILEKAAADGTNIYVFTCDAWTYSTSYYNQGESAIFTLPDFSSYDGIILHGDTIYDKDAMDKVVNKIKKSKVPCISLNVRYPGMLHISMENGEGIYEITRHMIQVHGARKLAFISGPEENKDAKGRLKSFRQALSDNGIKADKRYVFYGDYHPGSGREAVEYFYELSNEFPDAVIAANDEMALGAYYGLQDKGLDVPGQVLLSGYDYAFVGRNHHPKITSVKRPETELGRRAYEKLKACITGGEAVDEEELKCVPVFTESCGCSDHMEEDERNFRAATVKDKLHATSYSEIIKSSSADFTGVPTFEQLLVEMKRYIKIINPEEFYLCMCVVTEPLSVDGISEIAEKEETTDLTKYSPLICIPAAYRKGEYCRYGRFDVKKLLPEEVTQGDKGKLYTVIPVHYQDRCYGYCVLGNSRLMIDSELFHLFIMNINNAIENIRKQNMLNSMVQKLNRMWIYDTLTGIFNRAGFFKFANNIINEAARKGNKLFVLFLDLDGLKGINDKYGHDEGDTFIKAMGNVLSQVRGHGELLMRYGGDEFVIMAQGYTGEDAEKYIERIQDGIDKYNESSGKPYKLEASIGYHLVKPAEIHNLEELIESADKEMYKVKKKKKRSRAAGCENSKMAEE